MTDEHGHSHGHETIELLKDNLSFVLVALAVIVAVIALAKVAEMLLLKKKNEKNTGWSAKKIACVGLFSAVGGALAIIEIPLPFLPGFYLLDLSEIAGMMAAFLLGPVAGVVVEFIKTVLHILLHGTHSAFVGDFASFVLGCAYIIPASFIYLWKKTKRNALTGLITGALVLVVFGAFFNAFYLIPKFATLYGVDMDSIIAMGTAINPAIKDLGTLIAFATVPFNVLKGLIITVIVFLIYKPLSRLYRKIG